MPRLATLSLLFAVASLVFILLLVFFRVPFPLYPLMSVQDALDLLTPLVLIPLYWLLFRSGGRGPASPGQELAFVLLAAVWVAGHSQHLAANSINNLTGKLAEAGTLDITATDLYTLIYFFDERLSHYWWYTGMAGLAAVVIYREWRSPAGAATTWWAAAAAGVIYGFTYFCSFLEGQSVAIGLPFAALVVAFGLFSQRRMLSQRPVLAFFTVACGLAVVLFAIWGIYWRGFPEFSAVGLI
jgi:hypothetical protein